MHRKVVNIYIVYGHLYLLTFLKPEATPFGEKYEEFFSDKIRRGTRKIVLWNSVKSVSKLRIFVQTMSRKIKPLTMHVTQLAMIDVTL